MPFVYMLSCAITADKAYGFDTWMIADSVDSRHRPMDNVEHPRRESRALAQLRNNHGRTRVTPPVPPSVSPSVRPAHATVQAAVTRSLALPPLLLLALCLSTHRHRHRRGGVPLDRAPPADVPAHRSMPVAPVDFNVIYEWTNRVAMGAVWRTPQRSSPRRNARRAPR